MTDLQVPRGASVSIGRVEGRLKVGRGATIRAQNGKEVVVLEGASFEGDAMVDCDFECQSLEAGRHGGLGLAGLRITGRLTVHGSLDVANSIEVRGDLTADIVDVGGRVSAKSISCKKMRAGGIVQVRELLKADTVDVGGKIEAPGAVTLRELQVGGRAEIGGGTIAELVSVGGRFDSTSPLDFGELQLFGTGSLAGGSRGKKIVSSGKLGVEGPLECDELEILGSAFIRGDCKAAKAEVRGRLNVEGSFKAKEGLTVNGTAAISKEFEGERLMVSGKFTAAVAVVAEDADVSGSVSARGGLKAASITVRSGTNCEGTIVADTVQIGGSGPGWSGFVLGQRLRIQNGTTSVQDVHASKVVVGPDSRVGNVFAGRVDVGAGCDVESITYTGGVKVSEHVKLRRQPRKVDKLPEPPL